MCSCEKQPSASQKTHKLFPRSPLGSIQPLGFVEFFARHPMASLLPLASWEACCLLGGVCQFETLIFKIISTSAVLKLILREVVEHVHWFGIKVQFELEVD